MRVGPFTLEGRWNDGHVQTLTDMLSVDLPWDLLLNLGGGEGVTIRVTDQIIGGGFARFQGSTVFVRPGWLRPDVIAHEVGHAFDRAAVPSGARIAVHRAMHGGALSADEHFVMRSQDVPHESPLVTVPHGWITMRNPHTSRAGEAFAWWFAWRVGMSPRRLYGPHRWDTDAAAAALDRIVRAVSVTTAATEDSAMSGPTFTDVDPDSGHGPAIEALAADGILTGFADGTFRPHEPVTRGQVATILARFLEGIKR